MDLEGQPKGRFEMVFDPQTKKYSYVWISYTIITPEERKKRVERCKRCAMAAYTYDSIWFCLLPYCPRDNEATDWVNPLTNVRNVSE